MLPSNQRLPSQPLAGPVAVRPNRRAVSVRPRPVSWRETWRSYSDEERTSFKFWSSLVVLLTFGALLRDPLIERWSASPGRPQARRMDLEQPAASMAFGLSGRPTSAVVALLDGDDGTVRGQALVALVRRGAVQELLALREHSQPGVRRGAATALLLLSDRLTAHRKAVAVGLQSDDPEVSAATAQLLQNLQPVTGAKPDSRPKF